MSKATATDAAQAFITKRRRAYPSLYWSDDDVMLELLGCCSMDAAWDEEGNIKELRGVPEEDLKESFTDEGWEHMKNALYGYTRPHWTVPSDTSPITRIPDHISDAWAEKLFSLCYRVAKIDDANMLAWITLHRRFAGTGEPHAQNEIDHHYGAFLKVKAALALVAQRLADIREEKHSAARAKQEPRCVVEGITVHRKGFASTDTAVVVEIASIPDGEARFEQVAILDRALSGSRVLRVADLKPLSHPSTA